MAREILEGFIMIKHQPADAAEQIKDMGQQLEAVSQKSPGDGQYACSFCDKKYKTLGWVKYHMRKVHNVNIDIVSPKAKEQSQSHDGKMNYVSSFMKVALLYRDIADSYKMGDGDRPLQRYKIPAIAFWPRNSLQIAVVAVENACL